MLFCEKATPAMEKVVLVAPRMSDHVPPPLVLTCHLTVGAGLPEAAAENVAVPPAQTVWFVGWVVMTGPVAGVAVPTEGPPLLSG